MTPPFFFFFLNQVLGPLIGMLAKCVLSLKTIFFAFLWLLMPT